MCSSHQGRSGLLWGYFVLKKRRKKSILRIYGFEGEAGREGGVFTQNVESNYRRIAVSEAFRGYFAALRCVKSA